MSSIAWSESFATGSEFIDRHHRALVELIAGGDPADPALAAALARQFRQLANAGAEFEQQGRTLAEAQARIEQIEKQLLQSEKLAAVGQLAAGVAHEINNPVGFISSNLGALATYVGRLFDLIAAYERFATTLPADHPAQADLAAARAAAEIDYLRQDIPELLHESTEGLSRVKSIVSDLKDFSRVDAADWQEADLNQGLESTLNVIWNELKYKAQVVKEYGDLPAVRCIPSQINQVFLNLLVNAGQAIESTGVIILRSGTAGDEVWVEIRDTGKGMTPEVRQRLFEPFFTTKPVGKGTGLGLSISSDIMKRHSGRIEVESEPGRGTTFRIVLPLAGEATHDTSAAK